VDDSRSGLIKKAGDEEKVRGMFFAAVSCSYSTCCAYVHGPGPCSPHRDRYGVRKIYDMDAFFRYFAETPPARTDLAEQRSDHTPLPDARPPFSLLFSSWRTLCAPYVKARCVGSRQYYLGLQSKSNTRGVPGGKTRHVFLLSSCMRKLYVVLINLPTLNDAISISF